MNGRRRQSPSPASVAVGSVGARTEPPPRPARGFGRALHNLALQDRLTLAYHAYAYLRLGFAPSTPGGAEARSLALGLFAFTALLLLVTRGELLGGRWRSFVYRAGLLASVAGSYFAQRAIVPALSPELIDARLLAVDEALFGVTPAVWLEAYATPRNLDWFSFFYLSYYWLLALHVLPTLAFDRGQRRYELLLGVVLIVLAGSVSYSLFPGTGPFAFHSITFLHSFEGSTLWSWTRALVAAAGTQYDIFPSLHTALPLFWSLQGYRYRHTMPYRYTWLPVAFFTANTIFATLFLRWHYAIDVLVGLLLAPLVQRVVVACWSWEEERARRDGRQPVWLEV